MSKRYTSKTFPEWTPPLFGWQYRWELFQKRQYVYAALITTDTLHLVYYWSDDTHYWHGAERVTLEGSTTIRILNTSNNSQEDLFKNLRASRRAITGA